MLGIVFLQFIGFQYSAYIAGEVRGNVKRGVSVALLGALLIGVIANSLYVDLFSDHIGFNTATSWGYTLLGRHHEHRPAAGPADRRCRSWR